MADDFAGMGIAVIVITASIILAGILIGVGRAFNQKRLEQFGIEELVQSVINGAIVGSLAAIVAMASDISGQIASNVMCGPGTLVDQVICTSTTTQTLLSQMSLQLLRVADIVGYYQNLKLDFGAFAISPFINLSIISNTFSSQVLVLNLSIVLVALNGLIALFIKDNALVLLLPIGLVLRTIFATRRVGGFLIALAIGLYLFYPSFVMIFPAPVDQINQSINLMQNFTNNSVYATVPVVDLTSNDAIAKKLDIMSGRCMEAGLLNETSNCNASDENITADFTGDLATISQANDQAISGSLFNSVIAPLFSLLVTTVFVKELSSLLGGDVGIKMLAAI